MVHKKVINFFNKDISLDRGFKFDVVNNRILPVTIYLEFFHRYIIAKNLLFVKPLEGCDLDRLSFSQAGRS